VIMLCSFTLCENSCRLFLAGMLKRKENYYNERIKITSRALRKFSMWMNFLSYYLHLQEIPHMGK